jgi:hypothetical protein
VTPLIFLQVQVYVDSLVKKAYDNWEQVIEYDGKSLVDAEQNNNSVETENELHVDSIDYVGGLDHQLQMPSLPMSVTSDQQINSGIPVGGKLSVSLNPNLMGSLSFFVPPFPYPFSFGQRCYIVSYLCRKFDFLIQLSDYNEMI